VPLGPARGLALLAVRSFGPALLHAGTGSRALVIAAVVLALLALGAGWFALPVLGLGLTALGWILRESAALLARIEFEAAPKRRGIDSLAVYGWALDAVIILLFGWGAGIDPAHSLLDRMFPPFMLIAQLRIVAAIHDGRWGAWLTDRSLLSLALMGAVLGRIGSEAAHGGAVIAAIAALALLGGKSRLTRP